MAPLNLMAAANSLILQHLLFASDLYNSFLTDDENDNLHTSIKTNNNEIISHFRKKLQFNLFMCF